ncbi:hypothetical protein IAD21_03467 [Abditibacteriota bacterium]|nr:hypothetical protein IAD21_03467 [Abditibacteriota bacterium]
MGAQPQMPTLPRGRTPTLYTLDTLEKHPHTDITEMEKVRLYFSPPMHIYHPTPLGHTLLHLWASAYQLLPPPPDSPLHWRESKD